MGLESYSTRAIQQNTIQLIIKINQSYYSSLVLILYSNIIFQLKEKNLFPHPEKDITNFNKHLGTYLYMNIFRKRHSPLFKYKRVPGRFRTLNLCIHSAALCR